MMFIDLVVVTCLRYAHKWHYFHVVETVGFGWEFQDIEIKDLVAYIFVNL